MFRQIEIDTDQRTVQMWMLCYAGMRCNANAILLTSFASWKYSAAIIIAEHKSDQKADMGIYIMLASRRVKTKTYVKLLLQCHSHKTLQQSEDLSPEVRKWRPICLPGNTSWTQSCLLVDSFSALFRVWQAIEMIPSNPKLLLLHSGINLVWNLGVVDPGKKNRFFQAISQKILIFQSKIGHLQLLLRKLLYFSSKVTIVPVHNKI